MQSTPSTQSTLHRDEDALLALLNCSQPEQLARHRDDALDALTRIPSERLQTLLSPTLACALLDATRLGGVERRAASLGSERLTQLVAARRLISRIAHRPSGRVGVGCLVPLAGKWSPIFAAVTPGPSPMRGPATVVIDDACQRVDGTADALRRVADSVGGDPRECRVLRTRLGSLIGAEFLTGSELGVAGSLLAARHQRGRLLPRWAAIGVGSPASSLDNLPPDVRLIVVQRGAQLPAGIPTHAVFESPTKSSVARFQAGDLVCFRVDTPADAAHCLMVVAGYVAPVREEPLDELAARRKRLPLITPLSRALPLRTPPSARKELRCG